MKTIKTLFLAEMFFKTVMVLAGFIMIALIPLFFHSLNSPTSYDKVIVKFDRGDIRFTYVPNAPSPPGSYAEFKKGNNKNFYFSKLSLGSKVYILLRSLFDIGIILLVFNQLIFFLRSVKKYSSFFVNNYIYFKRIGNYFCILLAFNLIIKSYMDLSMIFPDGIAYETRLSFEFPLSNCAVAILSFVASLVFKEGERLRSENDLTV